MKVVCAWCESLIRDDPGRDPPVSHGICPDCRIAFVATRPIELNEVLNRLSFPILAFDGDAVVVGANKTAADLLHKPMEEMIHRRGGNVIECRHAATKEGCGRTEHCSGCNLRNAIKATYQDGEPRYGETSDHMVGPDSDRKSIRLSFSTVKRGDTVILTMEGA